MTNDNKDTVRRIFELAWNRGDFAVVEEIVSAEYVDHDSYDPWIRGPEGVKRRIQAYREALRGYSIAIEIQLAEGELVATRWVARGILEGALFGIEATHEEVVIHGISIDRFLDGMLLESWTSWDTSRFQHSRTGSD